MHGPGGSSRGLEKMAESALNGHTFHGWRWRCCPFARGGLRRKGSTKGSHDALAFWFHATISTIGKVVARARWRLLYNRSRKLAKPTVSRLAKASP
jgi:hypothetical protein